MHNKRNIFYLIRVREYMKKPTYRLGFKIIRTVVCEVGNNTKIYKHIILSLTFVDVLVFNFSVVSLNRRSAA